MEIYIYDKNFLPRELVEDFDSCVWTNRWQDVGETILQMPTSALKTFDSFADMVGCYLYYKEADDYMIIDGYEISYDVSSGEKITISAREPLSLLERRVVWEQTIVSGNLATACNKLISDAITNPSIASRNISNFSIGAYTCTKTIDSAQFTGDNLLEAILGLCGEYYSPRIKIKNKGFVFDVYEGKDRTGNILVNGMVVFSKDFDNLISLSSLYNIKTLATSALILGEGEGTARKRQTIAGVETGIDRRELYVDARDVSSDNGAVSTTDYNNQLIQRGYQGLNENRISKAIEATIDIFNSYQYGVDYSIGDIIRIDDSRTMHSARITEFIRSQDISGESAYPNFEIIT